MNWTCEQIEASLSEYLDGLLDAGARANFEAHTKECARCAPLVAQFARIIGALRQLEMLAEPPGLADRILEKTLGRRARKAKGNGLLDWFQPLLRPQFAYGAVSVLVTFGMLFSALGVDWRKPKLAELNPVNAFRAADREAHLVYAHGAKFFSDLRVVYEIQSRLRPETDPQTPPESNPQPANPVAPGSTNGPQKNPRGLNRVKQFSQGAVLASALSRVPERSLP